METTIGWIAAIYLIYLVISRSSFFGQECKHHIKGGITDKNCKICTEPCRHGIEGGITRERCPICAAKCPHGIPGGITRGLCPQCNEVCEHGVIGGRTRKLCLICKKEIEEREEQLRIIQEKRERILAQARAEKERREKEIRQKAYNARMRNRSYIEGLDGFEFENYVCDMYSRLGYSVTHTPFTGDGGKDAILRDSEGNVYLVECKHYISGAEIGTRDLRIFDSAMHDYNAKRGFYINLGRFKRGTNQFAQTHRIDLIGMEKFLDLVEKAYPLN